MNLRTWLPTLNVAATCRGARPRENRQCPSDNCTGSLQFHEARTGSACRQARLGL